MNHFSNQLSMHPIFESGPQPLRCGWAACQVQVHGAGHALSRCGRYRHVVSCGSGEELVTEGEIPETDWLCTACVLLVRLPGWWTSTVGWEELRRGPAGPGPLTSRNPWRERLGRCMWRQETQQTEKGSGVAAAIPVGQPSLNLPLPATNGKARMSSCMMSRMETSRSMT